MIGERQQVERLGLEEQSSTAMQELTNTAYTNMAAVDRNRIAASSASSRGETNTPPAVNVYNSNSTTAEREESSTVEILLASEAPNSVSPFNSHGRNDTADNNNNNHDVSATQNSSSSTFSSSTSLIPQQPHPTTNPQNHQQSQHRRRQQQQQQAPYTRTFNLHPLLSMLCTLLFQPLLNLMASFYTLTAYCFSFWMNFLFVQVLPTQQQLYYLSIVLLSTHFVSVEWNKRDVASLLLPPPPPPSSSSSLSYQSNNNNRYVVMSYHDYNTNSLRYYYSWDNDHEEEEEHDEGGLLHMIHSGVLNNKDVSIMGRAHVVAGPGGGGGRHEMEAMILVRYLLPPLVLLLGTLTLLLSIYLFMTIVSSSSPTSSSSETSTLRLSNYHYSSRNDRNNGDGDGDDTRTGPDEPVLLVPPQPPPPPPPLSPPIRTFTETESPTAFSSSPSLLAMGIGTLLLMESILPLCIYMYGTYLWFVGVVPLSMGVGVMALLWLITFVGTGWMRSVLYRNMGHG